MSDFDKQSAKNGLISKINSEAFFFFKSAKSYGFICPLCGNGSGKNGTGVKQMDSKPELHKCFKCGECHDVIGWLMAANRMDFKEALKYGAEQLGLMDLYNAAFEGQSNFHFMGDGMRTQSSVEVIGESAHQIGQTDYSDYYRQIQVNLQDTNYWKERGLSLEICMKHNIGYDANWRSPVVSDKVPTTPRLIIPTSKYSYVAVDVRNRDMLTEVQRKYVKMKVGSSRFLNFDNAMNGTYVFVVEGEFDMLSYAEMGFNAVSLGSVVMVEKFVNELKEKKMKNKKMPIVIIALDNDEAGKLATEKFAKLLDEAQIVNTIINFGEYKDANEVLIEKGKDEFKVIAQFCIKEAFKRAEIAYNALENDDTSKTIKNDEQTLLGANMNVTEANITDFEYFEKQLSKDVDEFKSYRQLSTGFKTLDENMYFLPGLYVLGAIPSLGKTTFALQLAYEIAKQNQPVIFFSYEQSRFELITKSIARQSYINHLEDNNIMAIDALSIRRGGNGESVKRALKNLNVSAKNMITYEMNFEKSIEELERIVIEKISKGEKPVVFVDYLQMIPSSKIGNKEMTTKETVDYHMKKLKLLQRNNGLLVFLISSLNRQNYWQSIDYESFKESGGVEYTCDCLLGLQFVVMNDEEFEKASSANKKRKIIQISRKRQPRIIELNCVKNRNGNSGFSVYFKYHSAYDYFEEIDENEAKSESKKVIKVAELGIGDDVSDDEVKPR